MKDVKTPASRATDPVTSAMSEDEINKTGKRRRQQQIVAETVAAYPGLTSAELAGKCGLDRYQVARRAPEAELSGRIQRDERRKCSVLGSSAMTWWPVGEDSE